MFEKIKKYIYISTKRKWNLFHNTPLLEKICQNGIGIQPPNSLYICFSKGFRPIDHHVQMIALVQRPGKILFEKSSLTQTWVLLGQIWESNLFYFPENYLAKLVSFGTNLDVNFSLVSPRDFRPNGVFWSFPASVCLSVCLCVCLSVTDVVPRQILRSGLGVYLVFFKKLHTSKESCMPKDNFEKGVK